MPPNAWEWSEKKWALDLWSREWVEERIITGVEVETEGERWVYDIWSEKGDRTGVIDTPEPVQSKEMAMRQTSWEEGEDATERRGDWRRRRWVRLVKRKAAPES
ncbi:Peroxisome size and maintenance regulator [Metarhizium acridum]|nr:Peroxisome size and maintenance regulator [Metarhizium acridum]